MDLAASSAQNPSGKSAGGGEALRKKFKKISIVGGTLKGAHYGDVSETDLRKAAKSYRGDPRFAQFCKQWVAAETVAPDDEPSCLGHQSANSVPTTSVSLTWKAWGYQFVCNFGRWTYGKCKGRWISAFFAFSFFMLVISRPAFSRLCGRLLGITIRLAFRRGLYLLTVLVDSILDEAAYQMETTLLPVPEQIPGTFFPNPQQHQVAELSYSRWFWHFFCVAFGAVLGRYGRGAQPFVRIHP
jgi:hypothetical protein